jgi:hypothetical protein
MNSKLNLPLIQGLATLVLGLSLVSNVYAQPALPSPGGGSTNNTPIDWDTIQAQLRAQFTNNFAPWLHPNGFTEEGLPGTFSLTSWQAGGVDAFTVVGASFRANAGSSGDGGHELGSIRWVAIDDDERERHSGHNGRC